MSADNYVGVRKSGDYWLVTEGSMSILQRGLHVRGTYSSPMPNT
jgi:hypothetical protein